MELPGNGQANGVLERAQAAGEQARLRALEQKPAAHTRDDLAKTAREFEGVFMDILMRAMRSTVPQNDLMGSGGATQIYRQMHDSEIARSLSEAGGGFGIAKLLESQFADQFSEEQADPDGAAELDEAAPARGLPTPLALARYRQGAQSAPAVRGQLSVPEVFGPPAPAAEVAEPKASTPTRAPAVAPVAAAPHPAADTAETAVAARPPRPNLLPTDRRLAEAPLGTAEADTVRRFGPAIDKAAAAAGLDPRLVLAVVMEESGGDPSARSAAGARGLMQLMPGTARDLGVANPADPATNLGGGARYLAAQLERYDGRLDLALAAYNAGPGNVDKAGGRVPAFRETRNYVSRVMDRYARLRTGTELDTGQR
ncbi:MAG: transglycosylase SLT domain-containing protein [bacterium]|jgi:soluble lytic murein transglycosylase-like protein|nr:transglycosylase SLT domain-containing protein [bacterium]